MDFLQMSPVTTAGQSAATTVATALAAKSKTAKPADTPTTGSTTSGTASSSATDSSTITANDFLTLLVSELKNQDPTQPTDPNAYIQQLVGVNSLQQLISINQGLTSIERGAPATGSTTGS
jgi:flagellar basal-body rod modification protein FlgD